MTGPQLVEFYNECGFDDIYTNGFPSRGMYSVQKIESANGTSRLKAILEEYVDPRRFVEDEFKVDKIVYEINKLIKYDGFALIKKGDRYRVADINGKFVEPETLKTSGHEFISEQIEKCQEKIFNKDYNGAITNARTMVEAVLIHLIETIEGADVKNDGNVLSLWSRAKKALKIDLKKDEIPDSIFQILAGLDTSIQGLAGLSNNAGDRHANKFNTKRHHAKLAVNLSMTICDFLLDVLNNRKEV
jgi:hypothetical protein